MSTSIDVIRCNTAPILKIFEGLESASAAHQYVKFWDFLGAGAMAENVAEVKVFQGVLCIKGVCLCI